MHTDQASWSSVYVRADRADETGEFVVVSERHPYLAAALDVTQDELIVFSGDGSGQPVVAEIRPSLAPGDVLVVDTKQLAAQVEECRREPHPVRALRDALQRLTDMALRDQGARRTDIRAEQAALDDMLGRFAAVLGTYSRLTAQAVTDAVREALTGRGSTGLDLEVDDGVVIVWDCQDNIITRLEPHTINAAMLEWHRTGGSVIDGRATDTPGDLVRALGSRRAARIALHSRQ